jgi:hypothetical protein
MKNYSETIKSIKHKTLTAKALKFRINLVDLLVKHHGFNHRLEKGFEPIYKKTFILFNDLVFDKKMTLPEIKTFIRESINLKIN